MIYTTHIIIGAATGSCVENPALAGVAGFVSHHAIDCIPHTDQGTFFGEKEIFKVKGLVFIASDFIIGTAIFYFIWRYAGYSPSVLFGAIGSVLPDVLDNGPWRKIRQWPIFKQHHALHSLRHGKIDKKYWLWGSISQIIVVAIALIVLLNYSH